MAIGKATPEQLDQILHRLGTDDAYREHFLGNPVSALAQHGVVVDPKDVPHVRSLPPKADLMSDRQVAQGQASTQGLMMFFVTTA